MAVDGFARAIALAAGGGASVDLSNYYTKEEIDNKGFVPTFMWDGSSSEDNPDNLQLFTDFYKAWEEYDGEVHLIATTPNAQNPVYMVLNVQPDLPRGGRQYFYLSSTTDWWGSEEWNSEECQFYQKTASVVFENGVCTEVSELSDYELSFNYLSTTREYGDGDYYSPISDGSPVSKGYMVEVLQGGTYSVSPEQLDEQFQTLITEPILTVEETETDEIEFVAYEPQEDGEYDFVYEEKWWGSGYRSNNGAHDNSYALGKFRLNNPTDKILRCSIDYDLTCAVDDAAVFSELDTEVAANSWDDYTNARKVITGESYTYGSITYDLTPGEHFITFKYMVAWKDEGEGEEDSLLVSYGYTHGIVQEHQLATRQYVDEAVANAGGGSETDLTNYYTKEEADAIINKHSNLICPLYCVNTRTISRTESTRDMINDYNVASEIKAMLENTIGKGMSKSYFLQIFSYNVGVIPRIFGLYITDHYAGGVTRYAYYDEFGYKFIITGTWSDAENETGEFTPTSIIYDIQNNKNYIKASQKYVDDSIANMDIPEADLTNYYTKEEVDAAIAAAVAEALATETE